MGLVRYSENTSQADQYASHFFKCAVWHVELLVVGDWKYTFGEIGDQCKALEIPASHIQVSTNDVADVFAKLELIENLFSGESIHA